MTTWNSHRIRAKAGYGVIEGIYSTLMYMLPEMYSAEDNLKAVDMDELALCKKECIPKSQYPCDDTVFDLCCLLMWEKGWDAPKDAFSAAELYILLRTEILQNM